MSKVSEEPTVTYKPYAVEALSNDNIYWSSNNSDVSDGIATVDII